MHRWYFTDEPRGATYDALLDAALGRSLRIRFAMGWRPATPTKAQVFMERAAPLKTAEIETGEVPGPRRIAPPHHWVLYEYRYDEVFAGIMRDTTDRLFGWRASWGLPRDPHFVWSDGDAWFASDTENNVAWMELDEKEETRIRKRYPALGDLLIPDYPDFSQPIWRSTAAPFTRRPAEP